MRPPTRGRLLAGFGGLVLVGSVLGLTAPAQAHNYLVSSTPAADTTLTALPDEFTITTNDLLLDLGGKGGGFALQIHDDDHLYYGDGCVTIDGPSMSAAPALGPAGLYTVDWQVVSADGHTVSDEFTFTWAPTDTAEVSEGAPTPPTCESTPPAGGTAAPDAGTTGEGIEPGSDDALWGGAAILAVITAIGVTILATRRRRRIPPSTDAP